MISPDIQIFEKKKRCNISKISPKFSKRRWLKEVGGVDEYLLLDVFFPMKFSMNLAEMVLVGAMKFPSPLEATKRKIEQKLYVSIRRHLHMANVPLL